MSRAATVPYARARSGVRAVAGLIVADHGKQAMVPSRSISRNTIATARISTKWVTSSDSRKPIQAALQIFLLSFADKRY